MRSRCSPGPINSIWKSARRYKRGIMTVLLPLAEGFCCGKRRLLRGYRTRGDERLGAACAPVRSTNRRHRPPTGPALGWPDDRLRRATQYSTDVSDRADRSQRTGSSAFADDPAGAVLPIQLSNSVAGSHSFAISPPMREFCRECPALEKRGRRECRALDAPAASHAKIRVSIRA
jgi:hypothetical protein